MKTIKIRILIYERRDDGLQVGSTPNIPAIIMWLGGFKLKPLYAINVKLKEPPHASSEQEGRGGV